MYRKIVFLIIFFCFKIYSEEEVKQIIVHHGKNDPQYGANIRKSEEILNKNIKQVNETLSEYGSLLSLKIGTIPHKTILTKGITKGDHCIPNKNQKESGDCFKVEQFDFVEGERGSIEGAKSKSVTLFFDTNQKEGEKQANQETKLIKIKSRIYTHNLYKGDKKLIEVLDTDPLGNPDHDEHIFINTKVEDWNNENSLDENSVPGYKLKNLENTISNPLRNQFKREAYLKHLLLVEKILSKIYHFNAVEKEKINSTNLKKTFQN